MKLNISTLGVWICCFLFVNPLTAQDKKTVLQDSSNTVLTNKNAGYLKDTSLLKKDTLKKAVVTNSADSTPPAKSHFQLNLTWESNDVYLGRADSTRLPLLTPEISYLFKSGFEIDFLVGFNSAAPCLTLNSWTLDGSYTFNPGNYSGTATVSVFNYSPNSGSVNAAQKGNIEYSNYYTLPFIQPSLSLTYTFPTSSIKADYQVSFALAQEFNFLNNGNLNVTPTATMNASTQNYYNSYYKNKRFSIPRYGKPPLPVNVSLSGEVLNSGEFQIMDYEFSAPVGFSAGKWSFSYTPTYAVPVNPPDIKLTTIINNQTFVKTYKEKLTNL
ncbi:MAG TPA: hypothetical protein VII28_08970, partial [Puia sp.]